MIVMKFGGTSVANADAIGRVVSIVASAREAARTTGSGAGPAVVVSAMSGVTDGLLDVAALAKAGRGPDAMARLTRLRAQHVETGSRIGGPADAGRLVGAIDAEFDMLETVVGALAVLREVTPRSSDALVSAGEILNSRMVTAACAAAGLPATWVDARRAVITTGDHQSAVPLMEPTTAALEHEMAPILAAGGIPVIGGFVGSTPEGVTTTLGRGGSDYSASIIGACLGATEVQIWTDVDGMLTADPRVVAAPRLVPHLSFGEAAELAYFGAKVLHPSTIQPAVERDIPVRILNSMRPSGTGTLITGAPPVRSSPLTALACVRDVTVIDIRSSRMLMAHGFLRRLFEVFDRQRVAVDVVTTSEVSVSVTITDRQRLPDLLAELSEFADVSHETDMALICAVGDNFRAGPTLFADVLGALDGVSLRMVSQAASRRNLTFVLKAADLAATMTRLHDRFFGQLAPGEAADRSVGAGSTAATASV